MLRVLGIALLGLMMPGFALSQSTGLTRLTDRDDLLGWEAVGRLDLNGIGYCTATLIAPDLVLTAAHCVYDKRTGAPIAPAQMLFRAGLRDGVSVAERHITQVAAPPEYVSGGRHTMQQVRNDVALLRLGAPITSADADPFVLHTGPVRRETVSVNSYGQGRSDALSRQRRCHIVAQSDDLLAFDCDVTFGSSGAPVFTTPGQRGRILSLISGGGTVGGRDVALGMALPEIVSRLKTQMRVQATQPAARVRRLSVGAQNNTGAKFVKP